MHQPKNSMASATDQQIKTAFEESGMTPEEISEDLGFQVEAVKAKLMQVSSKYRKACGMESLEEDALNFSNDQLQRANEVIYELAVGSEDDHLRFKAATYIRDDKKGRKEVVKALGNTSFNMFQFNGLLQNARQGAEKMRELMQQKDKAIPV